MSHEIEAKIKVAVLQPFSEKLARLGARFVHRTRQVDTYFMDTHKLLHKKNCGLRIREESIDGVDSARITFKGACTGSRYKSRPEFETGISDAAVMQNIFEELGYHKRLTVCKQRQIWAIDSCWVCLDELEQLGCFVEVEGPDEDTIAAVLEKIGLGDEPHIHSGYATMTELALKLEGIDGAEAAGSE